MGLTRGTRPLLHRLGSNRAGVLILSVVCILRGILFIEWFHDASATRLTVILPSGASVAVWFLVGAVGGLSFLIPALQKHFVFAAMFVHFLWGVFYLVAWSESTGTRGAGAMLLYWTIAALIFWGFLRTDAPPVVEGLEDMGDGMED